MEQVLHDSKCNRGEGGPGVASDDGGGGCAEKGAWVVVVRCKGGVGWRLEAGHA
jgi:hypothetical protein